MPKTVEAKIENSRAALKWDSVRLKFFPEVRSQNAEISGYSAFLARFQNLAFLPDCNMVRVGHANKVQQAGHNDVLRAIISGRVRDDAVAQVHHPRKDVQTAGAHIANESENVKNIAAIGLINSPLHHQAKHEHHHHGPHQQKAANPAFLNQVS